MFVLQIEQEAFVMSGHTFIIVSVPRMQTTQALICVIQHKAVCKRRDIIGHATDYDGWLVRVGR